MKGQMNMHTAVEILGLAPGFTHADVHSAYKACRTEWEAQAAQHQGAAKDLTTLDEIEWAYRELITHLEERAAGGADDDSVVSALLIPGLSAETIRSLEDNENVVYLNRRPDSAMSHGSIPASALELPEFRNAFRSAAPLPDRSSSIGVSASAQRRVRTLAGEGEKIAVQVRARDAGTEVANQRLVDIIQSTQTVSGALLKKLREELGVSLDELALRTKVAKKHLQDIEEDRCDALPAAVYFRGFIVSYLRYLGLERDDLVDAITENYKSRKRLQSPRGGR